MSEEEAGSYLKEKRLVAVWRKRIWRLIEESLEVILQNISGICLKKKNHNSYLQKSLFCKRGGFQKEDMMRSFLKVEKTWVYLTEEELEAVQKRRT